MFLPEALCALSLAALLFAEGTQGRHHQHHHQHHQELIAMLENKLLAKPLEQRKAPSNAKEEVCSMVAGQNATLLQSISKSTGMPVKLVGAQFSLSYCEQPDTECAEGANCVTVYRWESALVQTERDPEVFASDKVLVPIDCLCMLNWKTTSEKEPTILEK